MATPLLNPTAPATGLSFSTAMPGPRRLGITGGIGSGKSLVGRILAAMGAPFYSADQRARYLMEREPDLVAGIRALFGPEAYLPTGQLDRAFLAKAAFADPARTQRLNALVHPAVEADYEQWASLPRPGVPYTVKEAALLFEAGTYRRVHFVLGVLAPAPLRISRTLARDPQRNLAQVERIIGLQMPEAELQARSHLWLYNDDAQPVLPQAEAIHAWLYMQAETRP